jgi:hypothetical protein
METSLNILGSMVIDVVGRQLDAHMIGVAGNELDSFRIVKGPVLPVCADGIDQDGTRSSIFRPPGADGAAREPAMRRHRQRQRRRQRDDWDSGSRN